MTNKVADRLPGTRRVMSGTEHGFELSVLASLFVLAGIPMIWLSPALGFYFDLLGFVLSFSGLLLLLLLVSDSFKNELQ